MVIVLSRVRFCLKRCVRPRFAALHRMEVVMSAGHDKHNITQTNENRSGNRRTGPFHPRRVVQKIRHRRYTDPVRVR
jgi:hypothetical protein